MSDGVDENIDFFIKRLSNLYSITVMLQKSLICLCKAPALFSSVIKHFSETGTCLALRATMVENPSIETTVLEVQSKLKPELSPREKRSRALVLEKDCGGAGASFSIS